MKHYIMEQSFCLVLFMPWFPENCHARPAQKQNSVMNMLELQISVTSVS